MTWLPVLAAALATLVLKSVPRGWGEAQLAGWLAGG